LLHRTEVWRNKCSVQPEIVAVAALTTGFLNITTVIEKE